MTQQAEDQPLWMQDFLRNCPVGDEKAALSANFAHLAHHLQPEPGLEVLKVQEMAAAWLQIRHLADKAELLKALQRKHAAEHYDLSTRAHYQKLSRSMRTSPAGHQKALAEHALGISHLIDRWEAIAQRLENDKPLDVDLMLGALLADGFSADIREQTDESLWFFGLFLSMQEEPRYHITDWLHRCRIAERDSFALAHRALGAMRDCPDPEMAKKQLFALAETRIEDWLEKQKNLRPEYDRRRHEFSLSAQTDRTIVASLKTLEQFRKTEQSRLLKLERELQSLQRQRQAHQARLEAIRNGHIAPRGRKPALPSTDQKTTPHATNFSHTGLNPHELPIPIDSNSFQENEPRPALGVQPADSFPEMELVQAVQESATNGNSNIAQKPIDREEKAFQGFRHSLTTWSDHQLAHPFKDPVFADLYDKSKPQTRKTIKNLINQERARRNTLRNFQPSG